MLHFCAAVVGLLAGYVTLFLRKGSGPHSAAGSVFVVSMLTMSASAAYIAAFMRPNMLNLVVGLLTFYLVTTGWWAGRRRDGKSGLFDYGALLFALTVGMTGLTVGFQAASSRAGTRDGIPAAGYFIFGSVAMLCATSDVRLLLRGGVAGARRIARHLWRMCLALLIATISFYPGQARRLPQLRGSYLVFVPHIVLIGSMLYWLFKVRRRIPKGKAAAASVPVKREIAA